MFSVEGARKEALLNLYPLSFGPALFTPLKPSEELPPHLLKWAGGALFRKLSLPFFLRDGSFYLFGELEEKELNLSLGGLEVSLRRGSPLLVEEFSPRELESLFKGFVETLGLRRLWREKRRKKLRTKEGTLYAEPEPFEKVFEGNYLLLEVGYKLFEAKSLQELLEKGRVKAEELAGTPVRLEGKEGTFSVKEVLRASEIPFSLLQREAEEEVSPLLRRAWWELLKSQRLSERFLLLLSDGRLYPASCARRVVRGKGVPLPPSSRLRKLRDLRSFYASVLKPYGWRIGKEEKAHGRLTFLEEVADAEGRIGKAKALKKFLKLCKPFVREEAFTFKVLAVEKPGRRGKLESARRLFLKKLLYMLRDKGLKPRFLPTEKVVASTREEAKRRLLPLLREGREEGLFLFLEEYSPPALGEETLYSFVKREALSAGKASQVVLNKTLAKEDLGKVLLNVLEQILAKTGNVPYKLSRPLGEVSLFVGLSGEERLFVRLFLPDGTFVKYKLLKEPEELKVLLEELGIKGKVVLHADAPLGGRAELLAQLLDGYDPEIVEVLEESTPRFFSPTEKTKGLYYKLSEELLFLATYDRLKRGTHRPLLLRRRKGSLPLETHASFLLSLTLMNYASFQTPKLPATLYGGKRIAALLKEGESLEGDRMFWL